MIVTSDAYKQVLEREVIFPKWKLLSFNPSTDTWAEIIAGTYGQTPIDLTNYVTRIDYSYDRISVSLTDDPDLVFHPDGGVLRDALKQGRIIRLLEGFEGLAEADWLWTFSGTIEGTYSWALQRGEHIKAQFTAFSRSNNQAWKRRSVSSRGFTVGSDWSAMFMNIVKDVMLLSDTEVVVPEPWAVVFDKNVNQIVNMPPWDAMEQLLFSIQAKPWFNGKGELDMYLTTQNRTTLTLANDNYLRLYESKGASNETINKIIFLYLSNTLSKLDGVDQVLGTATITAGFILNSQSAEVYYSDERKTRSDNPRLVVKQSVNQSFLPIGRESMTKFDEFHVRIDVEVPIWAGAILAYSLAVLSILYVAQAVSSAGGPFTLKVTLSLAIAVAALLMLIFFYISTIGTGQYEVRGTPYEMVYLEQQAIVRKAGIEFWEEREKEIRNDFISTLEAATPLVINELHYEVMKEHPRTVILRYDPRIEPGDIIELSSTIRLYVASMSRSLSRGDSAVSTMNLDGWRTSI